MSLTNAIETSLLQLIFNATTWTSVAQNAATSPSTAFFVSLHTADPGEAGTQSTSETAYGSYARQSVARTTGGWTVSANAVSNVAAVTFPQATSGPSTVTYHGVGLLVSGTGTLLMRGLITSPGGGLVVNTGVQPVFNIGQLVYNVD
jgi:hypothetical protein